MPRRRPWISSKDTVSIVIAILGLIGTFVTVYFGFLGNVVPGQNEIKATQLAETKLTSAALPPEKPTSAPVLIAPTNTATTVSQLLDKGFTDNCIYSSIWTPYKGDAYQVDSNGCWQLIKYGFLVQDKDLLLSIENSGYAAQIGIYASLPQKARVDFSLQLVKLATTFDQSASFSFGIIQNNPVDINLGKYLTYQYNGVSQPDYLNIKLGDASDNETYLSNRLNFNSVKSQVTILVDSARLQFFIDGNQVGDTSMLPFSEKCFWIGFNLPADSKLLLSISDFSITTEQ